MKKFLAGLATGLFMFGMVGMANATLILSGDSNIGNPINGTSGASIDPGNSTFFGNILGAGSNVLIQDEYYSGSGYTSTNAINNYYNGLGGVSSSLFSGTVGGADLAGVDLFISILPSNDYLASEISAFSNFLSGGGTLFFMGENAQYFTVENSRINTALTSLGSAMQLGSASIDAGFHQTINIDADPFTAGVNTFTYGYTSNVVTGGTSLLRTAYNNTTFVAYEGAASVPEPATMLLLGTALAGMAVATRRKKS